MQRFLLAIVVLIQVIASENFGSISGRLLTPMGTPIQGARIAAAVADPAVEESGLTLASLAQTGADGKYTLENVAPGKYVLTVGRVNAPVFYPNGPRASATVISVSAGARIVGIDFRSELLGEAVVSSIPSATTLRNTVVAGISLPSARGSGQANSSFAVSSFIVANPSPGIYTVITPSSAAPPTPPSWIAAPWAVEIPLREVIGRVEVEPRAVPGAFSLNVIGLFGMKRRGVTTDTLAELNRLPTSLRDPLFSAWGIYDPQLLSVEANPSSREAFRFLLPEGSYAVLDGLPLGGAGSVFIKSATYGSTNLLTAPLEIKGSVRPELRIVLGTR